MRKVFLLTLCVTLFFLFSCNTAGTHDKSGHDIDNNFNFMEHEVPKRC